MGSPPRKVKLRIDQIQRRAAGLVKMITEYTSKKSNSIIVLQKW